MLGQEYVTGNDRLLGNRRPTREPEDARKPALVHLGVLGEPRFLRMLRDNPTEGLHVLQRPPHEHGVMDALAVVAEDPHLRLRVRHRTELGHLLAEESGRHSANGPNIDKTTSLAKAPHLLDDTGSVSDRVGIRHGMNAGEATKGGRARARLDGLGILAAGLAQMRMQVDETG